MTINQYLENINRRYQSGRSREHSYRGDLQTLLESLLNNIDVTNEPARVECGAPDYILTRNDIPVGYIEAKDIGDSDLKGKKKHKEQFDRYKATRDPFIFTDYLSFLFYLDGKFITSARIAHVEGSNIMPKHQEFDPFKNLIKDFATQPAQTIHSASKLSDMMAGKARLTADIIKNALQSDETEANAVREAANNTLQDQYEAFRDVLMHDIDPQKFAGLYAQTIAYGMFAARLHDPTPDDFTRHEAARLIPRTNPFLRKMFQYIAGYDLDERITWVVNSLADIFRATDIAELLDDFGDTTGRTDPFIHFYEDFLAKFNPGQRKNRGVYYTPEPVVNFIVRAVDDILKNEFGLNDGLADTSKTTIKVKTDVKDGRKTDGYKEVEREVHKVQILDPATGTGTFLAEVVKQIHSNFEGQQGVWPNYVDNHLIPRLNGFEVLMAPYAMAHLKLDLLLRETGYDRESQQRFHIYLTNALEEHHRDTDTLFARWLSDEANQANRVKRDTPVMVVMGNPPYSGISSNMGDWITGLIEDYKYVDGEHFGERKHWLHDDYVKFIRYGQHFVDRNGEGVLAYINNHSFLDNPTFRGMRWNLLKTFDKIYVIDLHGNTMKHESPPDGEDDQNVFDIQQGVSINIFIKKGEDCNNSLAKVFHLDFWGNREKKYEKLKSSELSSLKFENISPQKPFYFFVPLNYSIEKEYNKGFSLNDLFKMNVTGIVTARDSLVIDSNRDKLLNRIETFSNLELSDSEIRTKYFNSRKGGKYPPGDSRGWKLPQARKAIADNNHNAQLKRIHYRPFDFRYIYYTPNMVDWGRESIMSEIFFEENIGIVFPRQAVTDNWSHIQITNNIVDNRIHYSNKGIPLFAPLYIYSQTDSQQTLDGKPERKPNLDSKIVQKIADGLGLTFVPEKEEDGVHLQGGPHLKTFAPIDLLDYIYAVLHSPAYRETYKEFLKIDFPRVPYPEDADKFWQLAKLGSELRQIHLLEHPVVNDFITTYPVSEGDDKIIRRLTKTKPGFILDENKENEPVFSGSDARYPNEKLGHIQINDKKYFGNVPEKAWNFYIGGYQPAQKWLKDRRGRELSFEEIRHYQKIIVALMETDRIMQEIDKIDVV